MAMATQSLTATIAATRAGTRILMREGGDYGARSLQRRRRLRAVTGTSTWTGTGTSNTGVARGRTQLNFVPADRTAAGFCAQVLFRGPRRPHCPCSRI